MRPLSNLPKPPPPAASASAREKSIFLSLVIAYESLPKGRLLARWEAVLLTISACYGFALPFCASVLMILLGVEAILRGNLFFLRFGIGAAACGTAVAVAITLYLLLLLRRARRASRAPAWSALSIIVMVALVIYAAAMAFLGVSGLIMAFFTSMSEGTPANHFWPIVTLLSTTVYSAVLVLLNGLTLAVIFAHQVHMTVNKPPKSADCLSCAVSDGVSAGACSPAVTKPPETRGF